MMEIDKQEPVAWMYHMPGDLEHGWQQFEFKRRIQSYEGMSCNEEDAGMIETPLYTRPTSDLAERIEGLVEPVARAISGAPFPSEASKRKARAAIAAILAALKEVNSHD